MGSLRFQKGEPLQEEPPLGDCADICQVQRPQEVLGPVVVSACSSDTHGTGTQRAGGGEREGLCASTGTEEWPQGSAGHQKSE